MTSALFHIWGRVCSFKDELINDVAGTAKMDAYSFRTQFGMLSGPFDLLVLILFKRENTVSVVIIGGIALVKSNRLFLFNGSYACCGSKKILFILLAKFVFASNVCEPSGSSLARIFFFGLDMPHSLLHSFHHFFGSWLLSFLTFT